MRHLAKRAGLGGLVLALAIAQAGCSTIRTGSRPDGLSPNAGYVAMGSSFAAGPGITTSADQPPDRCSRSADNYAHVFARRFGLRLKDVSCSGAVSAHLLGAWNELPAQVDALDADTRLVTVTIGGNDVGYIGAMGSASCRSLPSPPPGIPGGRCPDAPVVSEASWRTLDETMRRFVSEVRRRAPAARIIFVDYLSVQPEHGGCASIPLPAAQAEASRATSRRLAALTARVAADTGSAVLKASRLSRGHDACSADPWISGYPLPGQRGFIPYHPNARGMAAVADALSRIVVRS